MNVICTSLLLYIRDDVASGPDLQTMFLDAHINNGAANNEENLFVLTI